MKKDIGIFWLREDFRLKKNEALSFASNNHDLVSAVYVYKKSKFEKKREAQRWWLYKSLTNFELELNKININLELVIANSYEEFFNKIIKEKNFKIYWNRIYEPKYLNFDKKISKKFELEKINFKIFKGNVLNETDKIKKNDGTPFKVFTPFWKTAEQVYIQKTPSKYLKVKPSNKKIKFLKQNNKFLEILPSKNWHEKFSNYWEPTESSALKAVKEFIKEKIEEYGDTRDIPGVNGTSKISPFLCMGQIHIETIWEECSKIKNKKKGYRKYINELGWREFSHSLINYFPDMLKGNLRKEFDNFPWQTNDKYLNLWKKGMTGYPMVDAGMRELHSTGWMHNRLRMITASFLVKHLRIHWQEGEKHFRNCLLDFNEANNVAGWQWVAGCGADAAPYFRIFNPILQGERFDKKGDYIKKWIPELSDVPEKFIHKPWEIDDQKKKLDINKKYPAPVVDHQLARKKALEAFQEIKKNKLS
ncbi:DNA photolyase family protein [Pelagibacteraceae bacterium]|jgi:deoxyribodipyrimidine photo-lyase|nr:DNA photolyase family protein [Pelagibacteraceae bacterium]